MKLVDLLLRWSAEPQEKWWMVKAGFRRSLCFSMKVQPTWLVDDSALKPDLPVHPYSVWRIVDSLPECAEVIDYVGHRQSDLPKGKTLPVGG